LFAVDGVVPLNGYSDRICTPEETLARVTPLFEGYGVTRLARITGLDRIGIPVWNAIRPNARSIAICQGKGITDLDAKVSAAMEALERAVAEVPELTTMQSTSEQLRRKGFRCDSLDTLIGADQKPIESNEAVDWVDAHELGSSVPFKVPFDAIHLDRTKSNRFWQSSDGVASGNNEEEAVFHGILERIERDAETLWRLEGPDRRAASAVDTRSLNDPVVDALLDQIHGAAFQLQLFDITSDIGIPAFSALLSTKNSGSGGQLRYVDVTNGTGAHPIAVRAAIRAITEAVQSRLTLISGTRDDVPPETYRRPLSEAIRREIEIVPRPWKGKNACASTKPLSEMTELLLARLDTVRAGPVLSVRLNPGEQRMAVAKILATGLENPEGSRQRQFGGRALSKLLVFR
jgi:ribosomal protein S12 methylthiotransferase accessory factor